MSEIFVCGCGAVSPAGWGVTALMQAVDEQRSIPPQTVARPDAARPATGRLVPQAQTRPSFAAHPRLRRTSPISQYAVGAALEALGEEGRKLPMQTGVIYCSMVACVNYSRRFYAEVLKDPATASPLVFPETVLNAPASHLAALLGGDAINYTLAGDQGTFLQGLALAASWLADRRVDGCLVVGAEEMDWLTIEALGLFDRNALVSEGAGALYLKRQPAPPGAAVRLNAVTQSHLFSKGPRRLEAVQRARRELDGERPDAILCLGTQGIARLDRDEETAWADWQGARVAPKQWLGEGFMAATAWQCVAAAELVRQGRYAAANVSVVGSNQQAIAAQFVSG